MTPRVLSGRERTQLELGLEQSFINKNKNQQKYLKANLESINQNVSDEINNDQKENFHELLRAYTDIFIKNVNKAKDSTYKNLRHLINDQDICIISADKDSCVVILKRNDYINKLETMINKGIESGTYVECEDTTLSGLKLFQDFLRRNFKNYEKYEKMKPVANQAAKLFATTKTHKFNNIEDINVEELKFRPIIDQTGTFTYNCSKVTAEYLKSLCQNEYSIKDTQSFPEMLRDLPQLNNDEENVSYDVDSLFTNIPLKETIDYILEEIYVNGKMKPICSKLIFKRLLYKLTTECIFQLNTKFFKQIDGCSMGGPLSVTLSDIHMTRTENNVAKPEKPLFYRRFVNDIINRRKKNEHDIIFENLNKYHPKMNLTMEVNPCKFLDTKIINNKGNITTEVFRKASKLPVHWSSRVPKRYKRIAVIGELHRSKRISSNFEMENKVIKR